MSEPEKKEHKEQEPLAFEIYKDLKGTILFLKILVAVLIAALVGTNVYHVYQWSLYETVVVDSSEGSGNANYVQGDNTGGIFNGESEGTTTKTGNG